MRSRHHKRRTVIRLSVVVALLSVALVGCFARPQQVLQSGTQGTNGQIGEILIRNVLVIQPDDGIYRPGESTVVRFELYNGSNQQEVLVGARSNEATQVRLRWDQGCDGDDEIVPRIPILPEGTVPVSPDARLGGTPYYLEIVGLTQVVRPGTTLPVSFSFERAGEVTIDALVQVKGDGAQPPPPPCQTAAETR